MTQGNGTPSEKSMRATAAIQRGVREALLNHARAGRSVPEQHNGQIVWVTPEEIFARYGVLPPLDQRHPPAAPNG
jgi:hypothetical protein